MRTISKFLERVWKTLQPRGGVTDQVVLSGAWAGLINVFDRVFQLLKLAVLARLLAPDDFGLMGIALLTLAAFRQFSKLGINQALIQQKSENVDEYLNTAWMMQIGRAILVAITAFFIAPLTADIFSDPRIVDILRVIALTMVIRSLRNPGLMYLKKNLEFHKQFVYRITGTMFNVCTAIGFAIIFQNVWALVVGNLAGVTTRTIVSYWVQDYRPNLGFSMEYATEMMDFGKWILGSSILLFLLRQGDDAFIGWFLGASALGFYQLAYRFSNAPATEVMQVISSVLFPAFSKVQDDGQSLRYGYHRTLEIVSLICFPMSAGIVLTAPIFVPVFLGEQWLPIVTVMQILAVWGLLRALTSIVGPLFDGIGRPDFNTKYQSAKLILMGAGIYIINVRMGHGLEGTAVALLITSVIADLSYIYASVQIVDLGYLDFLQSTGYPIVGSLVMGAGVLAVRDSIVGLHGLVEFILLVCTGVILYSSTVLLFIKYGSYPVGRTFKTIQESFAN